ncbi:MAG: hypothetical protein MUF62_12595, partial [Chitinophagaceae bacterium]|nr:hypothetical protein [Chitinophagaceae bacterium]
RRNSTDVEDLFYAHIGGMDAFARSLLIADRVLRESPYKAWRQQRYASFDQGAGHQFEQGQLSLADLRNLAVAAGEPVPQSGRQEYLELLRVPRTADQPLHLNQPSCSTARFFWVTSNSFSWQRQWRRSVQQLYSWHQPGQGVHLWFH